MDHSALNTRLSSAAPVARDEEPAARQLHVMSALKRFRMVFRAAKRHFMEVERQCGVGGAQLWALSTILAQPGIRVTELARQLAVHQSTASNLVEELVRQGLAERRRDNPDRRVVSLAVTEAGNALLSRISGPHEGLLPEALGRLDMVALAMLDESLGDLVRVMDAQDEGTGFKPMLVSPRA